MTNKTPAQKAFRNGMIAIIILEIVGIYAVLNVLSGMYFYTSVSDSCSLQNFAKNAQVYVTIALWLIYSVGMPFVVYHDFPRTEDAKTIYNATHKVDNSLIPKLKLGDDIANFIRVKGSVTKPASTIYQDIQDIQKNSVDDPAQDRPKPAESQDVSAVNDSTNNNEVS